MSPPPSSSTAHATATSLAERVATGDAQAESELIERYSRGVRIILQRHTRSQTEAEDLYQETFSLALVKLRARELRDPSKLNAFLSSLARNLATEHYRKQIRRKTEADSEAVETGSQPGIGGAAAESLGASPLKNVLRGEEARLVRRTLEDLPTRRDREILFRFYLADEDKEAIATDLDLTSLQFNRVLHRARQRYKELYLQSMQSLGEHGDSASLHLLACLIVGCWWFFFALMRLGTDSYH